MLEYVLEMSKEAKVVVGVMGMCCGSRISSVVFLMLKEYGSGVISDQIYGLLKSSTQPNAPHYRLHGEIPPQTFDSPMGLPPHTKTHTATHTSHPHSTCRTKNYAYAVKYLKAKDQFNMNIMYNNEISLLFETMY
jgi:hypothetical protein